jgi:hypothetical protein
LANNEILASVIKKEATSDGVITHIQPSSSAKHTPIEKHEDEKLLGRKRKNEEVKMDIVEKKFKVNNEPPRIQAPIANISTAPIVPQPKKEVVVKEVKEKDTHEKKFNRMNESLGLIMSNQKIGGSQGNLTLKKSKSSLSVNKLGEGDSESLQSSSSDES